MFIGLLLTVRYTADSTDGPGDPALHALRKFMGNKTSQQIKICQANHFTFMTKLFAS